MQDRTKEELFEAKRIIEKESIKLAMPQLDDSAQFELAAIVAGKDKPEAKHMKFFTFLLEKSDNQLLLKIWTLMEEFSRTINKACEEPSFYEAILEIISTDDYDSVDDLYKQQDHLSEA